MKDILKMAVLSIAAVISGCIGILTIVFGAYLVPRTPTGFLGLLMAITAMLFFLLFAIYCGFKTYWIHDKLRNRRK